MSQITPKRFLFTLWEGGGNVPPQLELARRLVEHGHRVRVMSDRCNEVDVRAAGCTFVDYTNAPSRPDKSAASTVIRDYEAKSPLQAFLMFRDVIALNPALAYAQDVLQELQRETADALVINDFLYGPMMAAEKAGIPFAVVVPNPYMLPAKGLPPVGFAPARNLLERARDAAMNAILARSFDGGLPVLNAARAKLGLPPVAHLFDQNHRASRVLVLTSPFFDFAAHQLPENVRYVGPVLNDPVWAEDATTSSTSKTSVPLVVVSFSTTFQNQSEVLQKVMDALAELPVQGIVTIGPSLEPVQFRVPPNIVLQRFARHSELFLKAAAVVTHGGHGTVIRALAAGAPLVCIPMGRDQGGNAVRVSARGAGKALSLKASVATIRSTIREVVDNPLYREAAQKLAKSILEDAMSSSAVTELEHIAQTG